MNSLPANRINPAPAQVIVVLGCRVTGGAPGAALLRRLVRAREFEVTQPGLPYVMSGGRIWQGSMEAQIMASWRQEAILKMPNLGLVPIHLETDSLTTRQNARGVGELCRKLEYRHIVLVTCDFHMPRAKRLFERQGLVVTEARATHDRSPLERLNLRFREWGARVLELGGMNQ